MDKITRISTCLQCILLLMMLPVWVSAQSTPVTVGYRSANYGTTVNSTPAGENPERKLWWNDGSWWGCLWSDSAASYRIYRFDIPTQNWLDTGTDLDDRDGSKADVLWDGQKLYVASHIFTNSPSATSTANAARLYRYSYAPPTQTYHIDPGFPVTVNSAKSKTLVLDKDSSGQLWVTWVQDGRVKINRSTGDDLSWGVPFDLPVQGDSTTGGDISSLIAFDQQIGVMWSNQANRITYFAARNDSDPDTVWSPRENALADAVLDSVSNDEINLAACDSDGNLYAATRTQLDNQDDPQVYILKRDPAGSWSRHLFGRVSDNHRQTIVLVDEANDQLHVIATGNVSSVESIYRKSADLSVLLFPPGMGTPFIESSSDLRINRVSATKQCLNHQTGLLVLANDQDSHYYLHNFIELTAAPVIESFSPQHGPAGTTVRISGRNFSGASAVQFNGVSAATFSVISSFEIEATVPTGASAGTISVTNLSGSGVSDAAFTVTYPPFLLSTSTLGPGSITLDPPGGSYDTVTSVIAGAVPDPGYIFSGWTGDLSGSTNPDTLRMDRDQNITAMFVANNGGQAALQETRSGSSSLSTTVATDTPLTRVDGALYLAAITTKSSRNVISVSGLGLTWQLLRAQCSGRNHTSVEIWMAQGNPAGDGTVIATLDAAPDNAVIAVSRYAWVAEGDPVGAIISGNTNGLSGTCSGGSDTNSYAFDITVAEDGAVVFGAVASRNRSNSPGGGFTEIVELSQGSGGATATMAVQQRTVTTAGTVSFSGTLSASTDWAAVAVEIRPGNAGSGLPLYALDLSTDGNGSATASPASTLYYSGTPVTLSATPAAGYAFSHWSGGLSGSANPANLTVDADLTITAHFTALPQYPLPVTVDGAGSVSLNPPGGSYAIGTNVSLNAMPDTGYAFSHWSGDLSGSANPANLITSGAHNVTAHFTALPQYNLSVLAAGSGTVALDPPGGLYYQGDIVMLTAQPDSGYGFVNWSGDLGGIDNPATITIDGDKTITAHFDLINSATFNLSTSATGGSVTLDPPGGSYPGGAMVTLSAAADSGYTFSHWSGDLIGSANPDSLLIDGHKTVTAHFDELPQYNILVTTSGPGAVQLNPPGGLYYAGTNLTLTALPDSGYSLDHWSGDLSGSANPAILVMDAPKSVSAFFTLLPQYTLTVDTVGSGSVLLSPPGGIYYQGTPVILQPQPDSGFAFAGWNGDLQGWEDPDTIIINTNSTVTAHFIGQPAPRFTEGIWTSTAEVNALPDSGLAWDSLLAEANRPALQPDLSNQDDSLDVRVLAKALVYARSGNASYRSEVLAAIDAVMGSENGGTTLAIGRGLSAYVIAADLVGLPAAQDSIFRDWLRQVRSELFEGYSLRSTHEIRPNNWGLFCGASRAAICAYLGDSDEMARIALVLKGWLGDRSAYSGFSYGELWWQADPANPVGINPAGSTLNGHSVDGVLPDEQRRAGAFAWPPPKENYVYEGLQGALMLATILHRRGYDTFEWEDQALLRAFNWLYQQADFPAAAEDRWLVHVINHFYGSAFRGEIPTTPGKSAGFTDWLYGPHFNLTLQTTGSGHIQPISLGHDGNGDAIIELTAVPGSGDNFDGWSGDLSGSLNPDTLAVNGDKVVTALFSAPTSLVRVKIRAFLEGPFSGDSMRTPLSQSGLLPAVQPFSIAPWNYPGAETVSEWPAGAVDWVLVKLRTSAGISGEVDTLAALVTKTGDLVRPDGSTSLVFPGRAIGNYYLVVQPRNHLPVMSSSPVRLGSAAITYDFSNAAAQAFGDSAQVQLAPGIFGLYAGDGNQDGVIDSLDAWTVWRYQNGTSWQYGKTCDFNLDGGIDGLDRNFLWRFNDGRVSRVPGVVVTVPLAKPVTGAGSVQHLPAPSENGHQSTNVNTP